jgi:hypothetical protein
MKPDQRKILGGLAAFLTICAVAELAAYAQAPRPTKTTAAPATTSPTAAATAQSAAATNAEREQIWNSPNMLRARAWLQEYCARSAKYTPEEKQQYMTELQNLSPMQMKLWLLKFDQEEESRQQQYSFWEQAHNAALSRAMAAEQATQKSYSVINREENQAAAGDQQQLNQQAADVQSNEQTKQLEGSGPYGPFGANGYGPYGAGYGGIHYHFHLYPY